MIGKNKTGKIVGITLVTILVTSGIVSAMGNPSLSKQVGLIIKIVSSGDVNRTIRPENENKTKPLENVSGNGTGNPGNSTGPIIGNMTGNGTGGPGNDTGPIGNMTGNGTGIPGDVNVTIPLVNISVNQTIGHGNQTGPVGNETGNNTGGQGNQTGGQGNETGNETGGSENQTRYPGNWTRNYTYHPADLNYDGRIMLSELTAYAAQYGQNDPYVQSAADIWRHGEYYGWNIRMQSWAPYHPADVNKDFSISISEVTSYAAAHGSSDPDVQSASYIWQHGESYFWNTASQSWSSIY